MRLVLSLLAAVPAFAAATPASPDVDGSGRLTLSSRFSVQTVGLGREGALVCPGAAVRSGPGGVQIQRGEVVEWFSSRGAAVEQSWKFERPPPGGGDLLVVMGVEGLPEAAADGEGLRWRDPSSGTTARYGNATWIDRLGRSTPIRSGWEAGQIVLRVPSSLVEASAYPAVLDPLVSVELNFDSLGLAPSEGSGRWVSIAAGTQELLAVWSSHRGLISELSATRLSSSGAPLDTPAIAVAEGNSPAVAFADPNFLVVWADPSAQIRLTRISPAGVVLDVPGIAIASGLGGESLPSLAYGSSVGLVIWIRQVSASFEVWGRLVSGAGTPVGGAFQVATGLPEKRRPGVASGNGQFFVAWEVEGTAGSSELLGVLVNANGSLQGSPVKLTSSVQPKDPPVVAALGGSFLTLWTDYRAGGLDPDIYGSRFNPGDLQGSEFPVSVQVGSPQTLPALTSDGSGGYLAAWVSGGASSGILSGARISAAAVVGPSFNWSGTVRERGQPALACGAGAGCVGIWPEKGWRGSQNVVGSRIGSANQVLAPGESVLSLSAVTQRSPATAHSGGRYIAVWEDNRSGGGISGARVEPGGTVADVPSFSLLTPGPTAQEPVVACGASECLIVWSEPNLGQLRGFRAGVDGGVIGPLSMPIASDAGIPYFPRVLSTGNSILVGWYEYPPALFKVRAVQSGNQSPVALVDSTFLSYAYPPSAAVAGAVALLAWGDGNQVLVRRLSAAANFLDPSPLMLSSTALDPAVAAASDGTVFLVVWDEPGASAYQISGVRVLPDGGTLSPAVALTTAANSAFAPSLVYLGGKYLLTWLQADGQRNLELHGEELVASAGQPISAGTPFFIASLGKGRELPASLVSDGQGHALVAYQRFDEAASVRSTRVHARLVGGLATGQPCGAPGDCANGLCVGGICCASVCPSGVCPTGICGVPADAGLADGGVPDAGLADGGVPDGGLADGGVPDGGPADGGPAGFPDGGAADAGSGLDAGVIQLEFALRTPAEQLVDVGAEVIITAILSGASVPVYGAILEVRPADLALDRASHSGKVLPVKGEGAGPLRVGPLDLQPESPTVVELGVVALRPNEAAELRARLVGADGQPLSAEAALRIEVRRLAVEVGCNCGSGPAGSGGWLISALLVLGLLRVARGRARRMG